MTMPLLLEEETGCSTGRWHPHNGYYAGNFFGQPQPVQGLASPDAPRPTYSA